jgi:hypothetical protein
MTKTISVGRGYLRFLNEGRRILLKCVSGKNGVKMWTEGIRYVLTASFCKTNDEHRIF